MAVQPTLETEKGKEAALAALQRRRETKPERIDNSSLVAGSPMTYYCISCGHIAEVLPEAHWSRPKALCPECRGLKDMGWLE